MLEFKVRNQKLMCFLPEVVASDTIYYLSAQFTFSPEWSGLVKWAHFKQGSTVYDFRLEDDLITADRGLSLDAGEWEVYLHGNLYESGIVKQRITTDTIPIMIYQSLCTDTPLPAIPASATEQIEAAVENAVDIAESVREDADAGEFDGRGIDGITTNESGQFVVNYSDGTSELIGNDFYTAMIALKNLTSGYKDSAETSANSASNSKDAASVSASAAANSETNASNSATSASGYANNANNSANSASASATTASQASTTATTCAQASEAWAVGKINGIDVPSTDDRYHNNAKYWAAQAEHAAGAGVKSFNSRSGYVEPVSGDYTASMVGALPDTTELKDLTDDATHRTVTDTEKATWNGKQNVTDNTLETTAKTVAGAINEVNDRIDNLSTIGRFLSIWNSTTGLPTTSPSSVPYAYHTGDYFRVGAVADGYHHSITASGNTTSLGTYSGAYTFSFALDSMSVYTQLDTIGSVTAAMDNTTRYTATGTLTTSDETYTIASVIKWIQDDISYIALCNAEEEKLALVLTSTTQTDTVTGGITNYRPTGTSYTGTASSVVESEDVATGDVYFFDGTSWTLQINHVGAFVEDVKVDGVSVVSSGVANITGKQNSTDNNLTTTSKTIVGAINEHETDISTLSTQKVTEPSSKSDGQAIIWDATEQEWVAQTIEHPTPNLGTINISTSWSSRYSAEATTTVSSGTVSVVATTFAMYYTTEGSHVFTYDGTDWTDSSSTTVTLETIGITLTGTPATDDTITVVLTIVCKTQTVTVSGATITANSMIDIQPSASVISQMITDGCNALYIENNNGTLTLCSIGTALTVAQSNVQVSVTEVTA